MTLLQNIGSIIKIEIALAQNITTGLPNSGNQVTVSNSDSWDDFNYTQSSASFRETDKQVNEGLRYDSSLKWKLAKQSPANFAIAHKYDNKPVVIRVTDANNTVYIIGTNKVPVYIRVSSTVPPSPAGYNGYNFMVDHRSTHPAYFVA